MARLFFAVWPDDATRDAVVAVAERFPRNRGRRVATENLHITLVFLGEVDDARRAMLESRAERVRTSPFALVLDRSGWWRRPQVTWLAPGTTPEPMLELVATLNAVARECGLSVEERAYRAHLTIARRVSRPPTMLQMDPIRWEINGFCLVESTTGETGSYYRIRASWPLMSPQTVR